MPTTNNDALPPVEQSDREAAANTACHFADYSHHWLREIRAGYRDETVIVQAFARHRLAHTRQAVSAEAGEVANKVRDWLDRLQITKGDPLAGDYFCPDAIDIIEEAVRPLVRAALSQPAAGVPRDVARLVVAARLMVEASDWSEELALPIHELDQAAEAFASRVPWDDEPDAAPQPVSKEEKA